MNYLGVDWGEKRIGLALGSDELKIATPFKTVFSIQEILKVLSEEDIDVLVIGKPFKMSGEKTVSKLYRDFLEKLKKQVKVPVKELDERLSSKQADSLRKEGEIKASRDELSAMIILQSFFEKI